MGQKEVNLDSRKHDNTWSVISGPFTWDSICNVVTFLQKDYDQHATRAPHGFRINWLQSQFEQSARTLITKPVWRARVSNHLSSFDQIKFIFCCWLFTGLVDTKTIFHLSVRASTPAWERHVHNSNITKFQKSRPNTRKMTVNFKKMK